MSTAAVPPFEMVSTGLPRERVAIDARYATTGERAIVGESLAGLFVVETFLREPELFDTYVAFDPSLWWNDAGLVTGARHKLEAVKARRAVGTEALGKIAGDERWVYGCRTGRAHRRRGPGGGSGVVPPHVASHPSLRTASPAYRAGG